MPMVAGLKDVENRTSALPSGGSSSDECWVAIVASANDAKKDHALWAARMRDVARRIHWNDGHAATDLPPVPRSKAAYPSQAVVALARLRGSPSYQVLTLTRKDFLTTVLLALGGYISLALSVLGTIAIANRLLMGVLCKPRADAPKLTARPKGASMQNEQL